MLTLNTIKLVKLNNEVELNKSEYSDIEYLFIKSLINIVLENHLQKNGTKEDREFVQDIQTIVSLLNQED